MKAYQLLADESKWCVKAFAKDKRGRCVNWDSNEAVRWCMVGAFNKIYGMGLTSKRKMVVRKVLKLIGDTCLSEFNDTHTHAEVLAVLHKANV
jgi:hypothetical protein